MNNNNPNPAEAPVPPTGTEQAAAVEATKQKPPKDTSDGEDSSDLVETVVDAVVDVVSTIFDG